MTGINEREQNLIPERPGREIATGGLMARDNAAVWDDGRQTYTLQWGAGAYNVVHGFQTADRADTLIMAIEAIRHDRAKLSDPSFLRMALREGRRLRKMIEAIEDQLISAARQPSESTGEALLSWREIGDELDVHFTTVKERAGRLERGERAQWHRWLVQDSPADDGRD